MANGADPVSPLRARPRGAWLLGVVALGALCGCGRQAEVALATPPPLESAVARSYTGWFGGRWHQEIRLRLRAGVALDEVADLRVFGPLAPGVSVEEATKRFGPPAKVERDPRGTAWSLWPNLHGVARVGCETVCSGGDCVSAWRLEAVHSDERLELLFHPVIVQAVEAATRSRPAVEYRTLHVATHDGEQRLQQDLESKRGRRLRWTATSAEATCVPAGAR